MKTTTLVQRRHLVAAWVAATAAGWLPAGMAAPAGDAAPARGPDAGARCRELIDLSQALVATARSGQGAATRFRIDVVHYRESLRELMKEDAGRPEPRRLAQPLLMEMVRMVALLQAAAECQTGRYIVCPADLIVRLERQQKLVTDSASRWLVPKG